MFDKYTNWRGISTIIKKGKDNALAWLFILHESHVDIGLAKKSIPGIGVMIRRDIIESDSMEVTQIRVGLLIQLCTRQIPPEEFSTRWEELRALEGPKFDPVRQLLRKASRP